MCTKGIWQLDKLIFRYCENGGSSRGLKYFFLIIKLIREWMRQNLKDFATKNPQITCETIKLPNRHPIIIAQYSINVIYLI